MHSSFITCFIIGLLTAGQGLASDLPPMEPMTPATNVCKNNDYALCSHARCSCLDADGNPGPCELFNHGSTGAERNTGWSSCTCGLIEQDKLKTDSAYRANFSNLSCDELAQPGDGGPAFPDYAADNLKTAYSTYSFGDSLPGGKDMGTLNAAKLKICGDQQMMALCLNMPCTEVDGKTVCYCQNVSLESCPSNGWNTLGTDCKTGRCDPGKDKVWSAACISDTLAGISALTVFIRQEVKPNFVDLPDFCPQ